MNAYREILEKLKKETEDRMSSALIEKSSKAESVEETEQVQDNNYKDVLVKMLEKDTIKLRQIKEAIKRIDNDSYGECATCGCEIEEKRLMALPLAINCLECQEEMNRS